MIDDKALKHMWSDQTI